jgi:hypothetical protein
MEDSVKNMYKEAKGNLEFQNDLKPHEPKRYKPRWHWNELEKTLFATVYMGWLIAKGKYNESNYK